MNEGGRGSITLSVGQAGRGGGDDLVLEDEATDGSLETVIAGAVVLRAGRRGVDTVPPSTRSRDGTDGTGLDFD